MLRRNLKHQLRYPSMTFMLAGFPIVFLLLFVYVFGGQLGTGLGAARRSQRLPRLRRAGHPDHDRRIGRLGTAIFVAIDMTGGIIDRFRTMAIARAAVLTGHVIGSLIQTLAASPSSSASPWPRIPLRAGPLALARRHRAPRPVRPALIWLSVALGLAAKSVETASNTPMVLLLLPFLSSGFVSTATLPAGLRQFAEYQPFTPVTQTVRGLLSGTAIGAHAVEAVAWSLGIAVVSYLWSIRLYKRRRAADPT